jgi:hypothetical protein
VLEALKGDIPKAKSEFQSNNNHDKRLVFFINQHTSVVYGSPEKKEAGFPHHPLVHGGLPSSPQQVQAQNNLRRRHQLQQMTKRMIQGLKRPINLPWPPESVPAEVGNDERQASHFLCPLVTVDFVKKQSTAAPAGIKK